MTVDERARYELQRTLIEILGEEAAMTLMSHLPPSGWADVATRYHIEALERGMTDRLDRLEKRQGQQFRQFVGVALGAVFVSALASTGIALAAAGLA